MEVVTIDFQQVPADLKPAVCCIGYFDGLHLGHQALLTETRQLATEKGIASGLITFDPDPWVIFKPEAKLDHICTLQDKISLAADMGMDVFYVLRFTRAFAALSTDAFHQLLAAMQVKALVAGFDFRYGSRNSGSVETLKTAKEFEVFVVEQISRNHTKISSSAIEEALKAGQVWEASLLLGRFYSMAGTIVHGFKRGSQLLNFPTANLKWDSEYIVPETGVYAGYVETPQGTYGAMINIGNNPTFENAEVSIEANIFDFSDSLYDLPVRFYFVKRLRDQVKFPSFEALKAQLTADQEHAKEVLKQLPADFQS